MNKKKSNLLESKGFKNAIKIMNICLIVGLVSYLIFAIASRAGSGNGMNNAKELSVSGKEYTETEVASADAEATDQMTNVYYALIQGSYAEVSEGKKLSFGPDGSFEGFFDNENPNVTGYTYEVLNPVEDCDISYEASINIYNADKSVYVQYKLLFDQDSNMQLYYPESKQYMQLLF
ncbi:MAG: hypothetical protein PHY47_26675 [Lachnospiraceae bacterium]|nr:hypothetical protein [Lachnospiraceae bacterium]